VRSVRPVLHKLFFFGLLAFSCVGFQIDFPYQFSARIVGVKDGDTYVVLHHNKQTTIRLAHIDCPESGQAFGRNAKEYASTLCFGKEVVILSEGKTDRYGRLIGEIYVGNMNVNKQIVLNGYGWHFVKYSKSEEYHEAELQARAKKRGLWEDSNPIAPWEWRKKKVKILEAK
jgi:micrococcal nuclease